jgi:DNA-binding transcriptional ArsR family regulator
MIVKQDSDEAVSRIAAAIGERARACMLYVLVDGHARTSTELAVVAGVSPSTASAHLQRLREERLVVVLAQGKHRYFSLAGPQVARALEGLSVLAGSSVGSFAPSTPEHLRGARTCYDHIAGALGVALSDRVLALGWLVRASGSQENGYGVTTEGARAFRQLGLDLDAAQACRRRFAYACLDWSERRPHIGGALAAALLKLALQKRWVIQDVDGRALEITRLGQREFPARFGVQLRVASAETVRQSHRQLAK